MDMRFFCHTGRKRAGFLLCAVGLLLLFLSPAFSADGEPPTEEDFSKTVHGQNGVTCGDCHGAEKKGAVPQAVDSTVCVKCHQEVAEVYGRSVHAQKGAAQCVDCHDPHHIKSYRDRPAHERVAVCARCHDDYLKKHSWLPNTTLHFNYLECATCHSPRSRKSMVYYFAERSDSRKAPLSYDRLATLSGTDPAALAKKAEEQDPDMAIGSLFTALRQRDKNIIIDASIIVTKVYHDYSEMPVREKACLTCHSRRAAFYHSMFFILPGKESNNYIPVKGTLFSSYPIGTFVDLFLLGEDKLTKNDIRTFVGLKKPGQANWMGFKLIDFIGMLLIVLLLIGISIHLVLRLRVRK